MMGNFSGARYNNRPVSDLNSFACIQRRTSVGIQVQPQQFLCSASMVDRERLGYSGVKVARNF
jgi:hypothetical protein